MKITRIVGRTAVAIALACSLAIGGVAGATPSERSSDHSISITGTLRVSHGDPLTHDHDPIPYHVLEVGKDAYDITGLDHATAARMHAKKVTIHGQPRGPRAIEATQYPTLSADTTGEVLATTAAETRTVGALLFNFNSDTRTPFTLDQVKNNTFHGTSSANAYFKVELT
jgi:hypothetical protein